MPFIQLNRQFVDWGDKDPAEAETRFLMGRLNGSLDWPMLLEKHRVVILAEAGSGKSEELTARADLQRNAGNYAFYTTVQEVARDGLPPCLNAEDRKQFEAWKASQSPAWIFVDSVDEAKLDNIRLETAFRKLADGIEGAAMRAHVVLSGRYTDWEFRADFSRFARALPVPQPVARPPAPKEVLVRALRSERLPAANEQAEARRAMGSSGSISSSPRLTTRTSGAWRRAPSISSGWWTIGGDPAASARLPTCLTPA